MKTSIRIIAISLLGLFLFSGCDDCKDVECTTSPLTFYFELLDKQTKENLFKNGTFESSQINISNTDNGIYEYIAETDIIAIHSANKPDGFVTFNFNIADQILFEFILDSEYSKVDCCSITQIRTFRIENIDNETNSTTGVISILVE